MGIKKSEINSYTIRKALQKSRPNNWKNEDDFFSSGLRGLYTIGEKLGDGKEDWSIMNYFDTKYEIHKLLLEKYQQEKSTINVVDWLTKILSTDDEFLQKLVERQWISIKNGLILERESVDFFLKTVGKEKQLEITFYPHGSKMDRYHGVDVTINKKNFQIKPLKGILIEDTKYHIMTYGMKDYKEKKLVDYLVFTNKKDILIFNNKDYDVLSREQVVFFSKPLRTYINENVTT